MFILYQPKHALAHLLDPPTYYCFFCCFHCKPSNIKQQGCNPMWKDLGSVLFTLLTHSTTNSLLLSALMFFHQLAFLRTHHMKKLIFVVAFLRQTFFLTFLVQQCRIPYSSPITDSIIPIIPSISWYKYYHFSILCMILLKVEKFFLI